MAKTRLYYDEATMRIAVTLAVLTCSCLASAEDMPVGFFHGKLLAWKGTAAAGILSATHDGQTFDCNYDNRTYLELNKWRVQVDRLVVGDTLEALVERKVLQPGAERSCYILSAQVVPPPPPVNPNRRPRPKQETARPSLNPNAALIAGPQKRLRIASVDYAGVVVSVTDSVLTLRTREGVETFRLRSDTRFLGDGLRMERADVAVNQRVSVEGATDADGVLEAFQVIWGGITSH